MILSTLRTPLDVAARMGGEEFAVVLPQTPMQMALRAAERLRQNIECAQLEYQGNPFCLTSSFGVAAWRSGERDLKAAIARADAALYEAKRLGRNRVAGESRSTVVTGAPDVVSNPGVRVR